jgi:hypothetical protein
MTLVVAAGTIIFYSVSYSKHSKGRKRGMKVTIAIGEWSIRRVKNASVGTWKKVCD